MRIPALTLGIVLLAGNLAGSEAELPGGEDAINAYGEKVRSGIALERQVTSADALAEANRLHDEVVKLLSDNKYDEALPLAKKVLQIRESHLIATDERIAPAALNLATIYEAKWARENAEQHLERALAIYEKKYGVEEVKLAGILDRLYVVYFGRQKYVESERAAERSLAITEKAFGAESVEAALSLQRLAQFYRYRKPESAEKYYDRALMIMRKRLPLEDSLTQKLLEHYACFCYQTGQDEKVKDLSVKYLPEHFKLGREIWLSSVFNGRALQLPKPEYSRAARTARASGRVIVQVVVDERGKVIEARDLCGGNPLLAKPSVAAALEAEFQPTLLSGQPIKVSGVITYNFVRY